MNTKHHTELTEVLTASQQWIDAFNAGKLEACARGYREDATMTAAPIGTFTGRDAIRSFWTSFVESSGATDLHYTHVTLRSEGDGRVRLSAAWSMNVGRGLISNELWTRDEEGNWLLSEDHFEVQEQFSASGG